VLAVVPPFLLNPNAVLVTNDHAFARIKKLKVVDSTKVPRH